LGIPVLPDVNDRVAGESGPRVTPAGVWAYCWNGCSISSDPEGDPVIPLAVRATAGTRTRSDKLSLMKSETRGARAPALEMMRSARGVATCR
jgi:hypothetical protein